MMCGLPLRVGGPWKVDGRLPGKGNSNSHGARPVHQNISTIKWIRNSKLSIENPLTWWLQVRLSGPDWLSKLQGSLDGPSYTQDGPSYTRGAEVSTLDSTP